jgi:hypothetical protein
MQTTARKTADDLLFLTSTLILLFNSNSDRNQELRFISGAVNSTLNGY